MLPLNGATKIFCCKTSIHMNRSFSSLPCLVKQYFDQDAASGHLFIFFNKTFTTVKILYWDNDGYAILTKQLANGRFKFPQSSNGKLLSEHWEKQKIVVSKQYEHDIFNPTHKVTNKELNKLFLDKVTTLS